MIGQKTIPQGYNPKESKRDAIDSMLTYVNKDLLICKLFYFFFFAAFGALYPLLAIYFKQLGMNATQGGILIGFRPFIEFCSAPFWGGVADKVRKWRQLTMFSLFCWIVFTLAMAFVQPPPVTCVGDVNVTDHDVIEYGYDLVKPAYSTVYYKREAVKDAFFALLLIIVIGEFFSAPAITFADTVTLSYLGADTDNYGRQRMFGSLGWALSMFFVGMALDHSTTFPNHPCEVQHKSEKNYIVCFAVFSVFMSCAFVTATQFKFPGQQESWEESLPRVVIDVKDRVMETITGKSRIDREQIVGEDSEFRFGQPRDSDDIDKHFEQKSQGTQQKTTADGKPLQISLESKNDMVSDVINSPGAAPAAPDVDEPFLGRWMTVLRLLAQTKYITVLFVIWFFGFGIGLIFTFLFWHLQDMGGSPTLFGVASVVNHMSELLAYFLCSRFISMFGHISVLYIGLVGNIVRFLYISWLRNPWWVLPFECLQGLTHAAAWATACSYISQAIPVGLRSSAQGILQGLHHGLGRGCGAVFGGILVHAYGSEATFRIYGVTCIFVLAGFFGINWYLKRKGVSLDSHLPTGVFGEESHYQFDPQGVPSSGKSRDMSNSKLTSEDDNVTSYGATLGTSTRNDLEQAFTAASHKAAESQARYTEQGTGVDTKRVDAFSAHDDDYTPQREAFSQQRDEYAGQMGGQTGVQPTGQPAWPTAGQTSAHDVGQAAETQWRTDGYNQPSDRVYDYKERETPRATARETRTAERDVARQPPDDAGDRRETREPRRQSDEAPRRRSIEGTEERPRPKERRRRQSGNYEAQQERDDNYGREDYRGGTRGRDEFRGSREDDKGPRRRSKNREALEGGRFQDPDPTPKEKIVFEQLPDISARDRPSQQQQQQAPYGREDPYRQY